MYVYLEGEKNKNLLGDVELGIAIQKRHELNHGMI